MQAVKGEIAQWGDVEHLLAGVIDLLQVGNYNTEVVASGLRFKGNPTPPKAMLRPGEKPKNPKLGGRKSYPVEEMRKILDNWSDAASGGEFTTEVK